MADTSLLIELLGLFFLFCILRVPLPFGLAGSALVIALQIGIDTRQIVVQMYRGVELFVLLAIPFFLLVGEIMNEAKITRDLVNAAELFVGRVRGALGHINIVVSMVFAGISGSSTADTAAVGSVMIPAMVDKGYSKRFSAAITAASSTMGNLIPPSLYMVIYGSFAGVSIEKLFLAGVVPGVLVGISQMVFVYFHAKRDDIDLLSTTSSVESKPQSRFIVALKVLPAAFTGVLVVGGMVLGWFTATEAAAIAAVYCLFLSLMYTRSLDMKLFSRAFAKTSYTFSAILFTIAGAAAFGWALAYLGGPRIISNAVVGITTNGTFVLFIVAGFLLILGTFLSEIATIVIFTPIFLSLQQVADIDPILMGVVVVMMLCLGLITPPYGICLLLASQIADVNFGSASLAVLPFIFLFLLIVLLVILFPSVALFLPHLLT